ncbi:threonine synthase [Polyrhizophydium stewartii]|uniref:threonine synthase n=1 Tax=Polyrhizophydium stewartii TaxID=2732419 RepID=A0ABR4N5U3_9FUNG
MRYRSTRGQSHDQSFEDAVLQGLAPDGGLYIPHSIPALTAAEIEQLRPLSFPDMAVAVVRRFIDPSEMPDADLASLVRKSFSTFELPDVVAPVEALPAVPLPSLAPGGGDPAAPASPGLWVLELFRGPTFAFKDVALQFLGNLFEYFLQRRNASRAAGEGRHAITVVGATSGDTGGAAIYGLRGKEDIEVFILHPAKRISPVQEQQMTSVLDRNVHNIALEGSFDDCQDIVKALFADEAVRRGYSLAAINSINWARILAQTTYYFYAYFAAQRLAKAEMVARGGVEGEAAQRIDEAQIPVQFSVPTGNFGDVLAGFYARTMGLPIRRLLVATNANDILHRFFETGEYIKDPAGVARAGKDPVQQTLSPAMDILVSSNFERLMWYVVGAPSLERSELEALSSDAARGAAASAEIARLMDALKHDGGFRVDAAVVARARELFVSRRVDDALVLDAISRYYHTGTTDAHAHVGGISASASGDRVALGDRAARIAAARRGRYVLDPHTAVGVVAAEQLLQAERKAGERADGVQTVCLATASAGKFPDAVLSAINGHAAAGTRPVGFADIAPPALVQLEGLPLRVVHVRTGIAGVRQVLRGTLGDR